ncbi:MAG: ATPase [Acidobacteria bacterium]|nr:ATPase [Acidobacteriota bacterium]
MNYAANSATSPSASPANVVGLDIGGTKTRGILWRNGHVQADATVGSANVQNVTAQEAKVNLDELFAAWDVSDVELVIAGSGGIDTDEDAEALAQLIRPSVSGAHVQVVHDTRLLLAAGGTDTGVAVIAGTGSAAWGTDGTHSARAGGWGYLLGDEGSGYWYGREAVRHSLHRMNLGLEVDQLTSLLLAACKLDQPGELIAAFHDPQKSRRYWAGLSTVVFEAAAAGHEASIAMIATGGADLAALAHQCAHQLNTAGPIVLGGGVGMHQTAAQEAFRQALAAHGLIDVRVLAQDPIFGVLRLAGIAS